MPRTVHPIGRWLDLAGLFLFLAAATVYLYAWSGMRQLERGLLPVSDQPFAAVARWDSLLTLSRVGIGIFAVACLTALAAAIANHVLTRRVTQPG